MRHALAAVLILCGLNACANVRYGSVPYTPIPEGGPAQATIDAKRANVEADEAASGIRYYDTSPYVLVFSDGKGSIKWKIYYLPDQTLM